LQCCGAPVPQEKGFMNNGCRDEAGSPSLFTSLSSTTLKNANSSSPSDMLKLQQQLQDIKEQVIIFDR